MSANIRKQLGPIRKRLRDRLNEVSAAVSNGEDITILKGLRAKLTANITSHEQAYGKLSQLSDLEQTEQVIVDKEVETSTELSLDGYETQQTLIEYIEDRNTTTDTNTVSLDQQRELLEIEKLKLENDCKRAELVNLKDVAECSKNTVGSQKIKLPDIPLPRFNGQIIEWPTFWDSFNSTIHANNRVSKIDKFKYLISSLEGDARSTLRGFDLTEGHYDEAVQLLKDRYDDPEFIIHSHYKILTNMSRCSDITENLRKTFNLLESQIRSLQSLGEVVENNFMVSLVKSKLPESFNLRLEETRETRWTLQLLRKLINKLIVAREKSEEAAVNEIRNQEMDYTADVLLSNNTKVKCRYCGKGHWSDECQQFKTTKDRKAQIKGRCFICLSNNHLHRNCASTKPCFYCKEIGRHHSSLCPTKFGGGQSTTRALEEPIPDEPAALGEELDLNLSQDVVMKTARVVICNPITGKSRRVTVLMDSGAKRTYLTEEVANIIQVQRGPSKVTSLNTFSTTAASTMVTSKTNVHIEQKDGSKKLICAKVCKTITGDMMRQKLDIERYRNVWNHLEMADNIPNKRTRFKVDLLVGNDYYDDIIKSEKIHLDNGLYLINSSLGWIFSGRITSSQDVTDAETYMLVEESDIASKVWELETIGVEHITEDTEKVKYTEYFNRSIGKVGDRYQVGWPWKLSKYELSDNYKLSKARLKSLYLSLSKDFDLLKKYDEIIKKQIREGIVEVADTSVEYLQSSTVVTHYIPHHLVKNENKVRIVYDGSAKTNPSKKSLNECLYKGSNTVKDLCGVILRFQMNPVALIADIEKAYLQMELDPSDRDVTRFLWLKDIGIELCDENIIELRFCRVIWGIVSAAFLLGNTVSHHLSRYDTDVSKDIERNLYVDNLASGANGTDEAVAYYNETKEIFNNAGMNMCKWVSNDNEVMKYIKDDDKVVEKKIKLLGMIWDLESDTLCLATYKPAHVPLITTKRMVAKAIASVYDPAGTRCPVLLQPKILLQKLWELNTGWDQEVPQDINKRWKKLMKNIHDVHTISTKRFVDDINDDGHKMYQLITFTDASKDAYAAAVYLKVSNATVADVNLIFAKARLRPLKKKLSIPRMELMGVLIGCRMSSYVQSQLDVQITEQNLYTDSECVLEWTKSSKSLKRFVMDRVVEIRKHDVELFYVKSEENPADIATRGASVDELKKKTIWWKGPEWVASIDIYTSHEYEVNEEVRMLLSQEMKKSDAHLYEAGLIASSSVKAGPFGIDETTFSLLHRLIRVTAWCFRFVCNSRNANKTKGFLSVVELRRSTHAWTKFIQEQQFSNVLNAIERKKSHPLVGLGVYRDDEGKLLCGGRFQSPESHLQLLPKSSHFTKLVIDKNHKLCLHGGVAPTLAQVRKEFWIIQARSSVRKVVRECLTCIRWHSGAFRTPAFSPYPTYVTTGYNHPFTFTGIDYLGPIVTGNKMEVCKNWICLFTCINTRAIHLELVYDMTCNEFLLALRRFLGRRGTPKHIISDNASQLKLGHVILDKLWKSVMKTEYVQSYISERGITWKFTIEYAPWKGGFYERLVGMTKVALRKSLGRSKLNHSQMLTTLVEVEAVLNSRPLVYIGDDISSGAVITPAHFTSVNYKVGFPEYNDDVCYEDRSFVNILESWKGGNIILNNFWKIWQEQYLPALRERKMLATQRIKGEVDRKPYVGEVVVIKEEGLPRGRWKLAKIEELIKGEVDGVERAAKLIMSAGKYVKRPFCYLYPLECRNDETLADIIENDVDPSKGNVDDTTNRRVVPKRKAAINARKRLQDAIE